MKTLLKRQDGFTLVELMVVVAIIGLLSAVAVPNFKKYQAKAKVSEAKLQLSAAYTAETSFFSDYNLYANCLSYMGFDPAPEVANRYYAIGFDSTGSANPADNTPQWDAAENSGLSNAACPGGAAGGGAGTFFIAGKGVGAIIVNTLVLHEGETTLAALGTQADAGTMTFMISASGTISGDGTAAGAKSVLTIDHTKRIVNVRNGY